jgi:hypothetical protein
VNEQQASKREIQASSELKRSVQHLCLIKKHWHYSTNSKQLKTTKKAPEGAFESAL